MSSMITVILDLLELGLKKKNDPGCNANKFVPLETEEFTAQSKIWLGVFQSQRASTGYFVLLNIDHRL